MTTRQTAYERTEPRAGAVLCVPTIFRLARRTWRAWIHVWRGDDYDAVGVFGYLDHPQWGWIVTPIDVGRWMLKHDRIGGREVPWERAPEAVRDHVLHVVSEIGT